MSSTSLFNMFWHGDRLRALEAMCMQSFLDHNHRLRVFTYGDVRLPSGVSAEDASRILPFELFFTYRGSPAAFTNIFRYKLLLEQGGWWVDSDVLCLKNELPICKYYWAEEHSGQINGAVLKFPAGDPRLRELLRLSMEERGRLTHWGQLGPRLLTGILGEERLAQHGGTTGDAYPIHWLETHFFWLPEFRAQVEKRSEGSTFLHCWNSMFGEMGIDVSRGFPVGSFVDGLLATCDGAIVEEEKALTEREMASCRESIGRYLGQRWVRDLWVRKLGRDIGALYPLGEGPSQPRWLRWERAWRPRRR